MARFGRIKGRPHDRHEFKVQRLLEQIASKERIPGTRSEGGVIGGSHLLQGKAEHLGKAVCPLFRDGKAIPQIGQRAAVVIGVRRDGQVDVPAGIAIVGGRRGFIVGAQGRARRHHEGPPGCIGLVQRGGALQAHDGAEAQFHPRRVGGIGGHDKAGALNARAQHKIGRARFQRGIVQRGVGGDGIDIRHRGHRHRDGGAVRKAQSVGHGIGDRGGAKEVGRRGKGDHRPQHRHRALRRVDSRGHGQHIACVAVCGQPCHVDGDGPGVFGRGRGGALRIGRVIRACDVDGQGAAGDNPCAVGHRHVEHIGHRPHGPRIHRCRVDDIGIGAIGIHRQRAKVTHAALPHGQPVGQVVTGIQIGPVQRAGQVGKAVNRRRIRHRQSGFRSQRRRIIGARQGDGHRGRVGIGQGGRVILNTDRIGQDQGFPRRKEIDRGRGGRERPRHSAVVHAAGVAAKAEGPAQCVQLIAARHHIAAHIGQFKAHGAKVGRVGIGKADAAGFRQGDGSAFGQRAGHIDIGDHRAVIGAGDGDGDGLQQDAAGRLVQHPDGEGFGRGFALRQRVHGGIRDAVGPGDIPQRGVRIALCGDLSQGAAKRAGAAQNRHKVRRQILVGELESAGGGQRGHRRAFGQFGHGPGAGAAFDQGDGVIGAGQRDRHIAGRGAAIAIGQRDGEGQGGGLGLAQEVQRAGGGAERPVDAARVGAAHGNIGVKRRQQQIGRQKLRPGQAGCRHSDASHRRPVGRIGIAEGKAAGQRRDGRPRIARRFGDRPGGRAARDYRAVIRALHRDGQGCRAGGIAAVAHRVGEHIRPGLARAKRVGVGVGVGQGIGPAAIGADRQCAVQAHDGTAGANADGIAAMRDQGYRLRIACIAVGVIGQHVARGGRIPRHQRLIARFGHRIQTVGIRHGHRAVIGAGDGDGDGPGVGRVGAIAHRHRICQRQHLARAQEIKVGGGVIAPVDAGRGARAGYTRREAQSLGRNQGCRLHRQDKGQTVQFHHRRACAGNQAVVRIHIHDAEAAAVRQNLCRAVRCLDRRPRDDDTSHHRRVIGPVDRDGQQVRRCSPMLVADADRKHIHRRGAVAQCLRVGIAIVQAVAPGAICRDDKGAVSALNHHGRPLDGNARVGRVADEDNGQLGPPVRVGVIGQHVAAGRCVTRRAIGGAARLGHHVGVGHYHRAVIGAGDGDDDVAAVR